MAFCGSVALKIAIKMYTKSNIKYHVKVSETWCMSKYVKHDIYLRSLYLRRGTPTWRLYPRQQQLLIAACCLSCSLPVVWDSQGALRELSPSSGPHRPALPAWIIIICEAPYPENNKNYKRWRYITRSNDNFWIYNHDVPISMPILLWIRSSYWVDQIMEKIE